MQFIYIIALIIGKHYDLLGSSKYRNINKNNNNNVLWQFSLVCIVFVANFPLLYTQIKSIKYHINDNLFYFYETG